MMPVLRQLDLVGVDLIVVVPQLACGLGWDRNNRYSKRRR
jgi:hypothetical protein